MSDCESINFDDLCDPTKEHIIRFVDKDRSIGMVIPKNQLKSFESRMRDNFRTCPACLSGIPVKKVYNVKKIV